MGDTDRITLSDCTVDLVTRRVVRDGDATPLTAQEAALLRYLAERRGQTVPREALFSDVLGYAPTTRSRALDAAIRRLRGRIEADPREPVHLLTVRGEGFTLQMGGRVARIAVRGLPVHADVFVGRGDLAQRVGRALQEAQLVTLHGPGGVGKSRLAAEVLRAEAAGWSGVVWVPVPAGDEATVLDAVAGALALAPGGTPADLAVVTALDTLQGTVVVLDAAEAAPQAVQALLTRWLAAPVGCHLLVTSRETLGVAGEQVIGVPPLAPDDAARLLQARAAARGADGWADGPQLRQLAASLDGLPLALELAAGRASVMRPEAVLARLDRPFRLLRARGPGAGVALDAVLEASWEPLDSELRAALVQLAVLAWPFDIALAEQVVVLEHELALDAVQELVRRSWLSGADHDGELRWLDSSRTFVLGRSGQVSGAAAGARERLADAVERGVPMSWGHALEGARTAVALRRPGAARAVEVALRALKGRSDLRAGLELAERALPHVDDRFRVANAVAPLLVHGGSGEALDRWITVLEATPETSERELALGQLHLARTRFTEAVTHLRRVLTIEPDHAGARNALATALLQRGDTGSAIEVVAGRDDPKLQGLLGMAYRGLGQLDEAEARFRGALLAHSTQGDDRGVAVVQANLVAMYIQAARLADAEEVGAVVLDTFQRLGDLRASSSVRMNLAIVADIVGDELRSGALFREALRIARWAGDRRSELLARAHLAFRHRGRADAEGAAAELGQLLEEVRALRLARMEITVLSWLGVLEGSEVRLRQALSLAQHTGDDGQRADVLVALAHLLAGTDPLAAEAVLGDARRAVRSQQVAGALAVQLQVAAARVATARGRTDDARHALKAADTELDALGVRPSAHLRRRVQAARAEVAATS